MPIPQAHIDTAAIIQMAMKRKTRKSGKTAPIFAIPLGSTPPPPPKPPPLPAGSDFTTNFPACSSPDVRTPPQFLIGFRRPLILLSNDHDDSTDDTLPLLAGTTIQAYTVAFGLDPLFEQTWNLIQLKIGDVASVIGLAPSEQLTLEFQFTQRKVLDQSAVDSTESLTSDESTTSDKEAVNVTRASSKTENWHVDTTGTLTCGYASLSVTAGYSQSVTDSNQQAISHIHDSTRKSAHSLKVLHKIEVRGVTETIVTNRMTRILKNPYRDRTLTVNVFQLVKRFLVETALRETRAALIVDVNQIQFDGDFVAANADFLRGALTDPTLLDNLDLALQAAHPQLSQQALANAGVIAKRALTLLFDDANIFNMPPKGAVDSNLPSTSFDSSISTNALDTGLVDSSNNHLGVLFAILGGFYHLTREPYDDAAAIRMATALGKDLGQRFADLYPDLAKSPADSDIKNIMDNNNFTEIFRRLPAFLTMVSGMLMPLLEPAQSEQQAAVALAQATYVLNRLLSHLTANSNYYIQRYLLYIAAKTRNQAMIDFVQQVMGNPTFSTEVPNMSLDVSRAFISHQQVIVPTVNPLTPSEIAAIGAVRAVQDPVPLTLDIEVPSDGIHMEVAEGACQLNQVPANDGNLTLSLKDANLSVSQ
jgi:hypothetical protein